MGIEWLIVLPAVVTIAIIADIVADMFCND